MSAWSDTLARLRERLEKPLRGGLSPLVHGLAGLGVMPNQVTLAAVAVSSAAALLVACGWLRAAAVLLLVAGALDLMDGMLARLDARTTRFGAFLDSTLDRVSEGVVYAAVAYHLALRGEALLVAAAVLALLGALLVSYARARAEALGVECKVGAMTRAERVLLMTGGLLLDQLGPVVVALAALTLYTAAQRILHVRRSLEDGSAR